jgi:fatty acid desaturase
MNTEEDVGSVKCAKRQCAIRGHLESWTNMADVDSLPVCREFCPFAKEAKVGDGEEDTSVCSSDAEEDHSTEVNVRESMRFFPAFAQPVLTSITGKPLIGEKPYFTGSATYHLIMTLLVLVGSVAANILAWNTFWFWAIPIFWWITVGRARKLLTTINHECVHERFAQTKFINQLVAELVSTLIMVQGYEGYHKDHIGTHHSKKLATLQDPDLIFLLKLGFKPGLSRAELWKRLWLTMISPTYHWLFLKARFTANFISPSWQRQLLAVCFNFLMLEFVVLTQSWVVWLVVWVFPMTILYHISALLQFTSEHQWLRVKDPTHGAHLVLARLTLGRFMGEAAPKPSQSFFQDLLAWGHWYLRMVFVHLPLRIFVIVGDLPQHDWHHRHPKHKNWMNAAYARQADLDAGCPGWPELYAEVWGLGTAIDGVFSLLSSLPPLDDSTLSLSSSDTDDVVNGM